MNVHYLQHVPFEGLGSIEDYLTANDHRITRTRLYKGEQLPGMREFDWLIVMGGPMGIYDEETYPWLTVEKKFIREAIEHGKTVLGICLGAQLIADVLGAKVYKNPHREIGWFEISKHAEANHSVIGEALPARAEVFHWHGDTFEIPEGAIPLASSAACANQGFIYDDRVLALQFHLETTTESALALVEHCADELDGSRYVQSEAEILAESERFSAINLVMSSILQALKPHD